MSIKYYARLDGIRAVAVLMVVAAHFIPSLAKKVSANFYGVNLFFVLSGFLITSILISDNSQTYKQSYLKFVVRRSLRIFPAYFFSIFLYYLFFSQEMQNDLKYLLTYTYNYFIDYSNPLPPHVFYWSLSVEEQFYLFFPFVVIPIRNNRKILFYLFSLLISIAFLQIYFDLFGLKRFDWVGLITNMAPLCIGALGALILKSQNNITLFFSNVYIEIVLLAILIYTLTTHNFKIMIFFSSFINLYIILKGSYFDFRSLYLNKILSNPFMIHIGKVSYGIYLFHGLVGRFVENYLFNPIWSSIPFKNYSFFSYLYNLDWIFRFILIVLASVITATLSYKYFETYFLKLKNRFN